MLRWCSCAGAVVAAAAAAVSVAVAVAAAGSVAVAVLVVAAAVLVVGVSTVPASAAATLAATEAAIPLTAMSQLAVGAIGADMGAAMAVPIGATGPAGVALPPVSPLVPSLALPLPRTMRLLRAIIVHIQLTRTAAFDRLQPDDLGAVLTYRPWPAQLSCGPGSISQAALGPVE
jgi:hypothetical protein